MAEEKNSLNDQEDLKNKIVLPSEVKPIQDEIIETCAHKILPGVIKNLNAVLTTYIVSWKKSEKLKIDLTQIDYSLPGKETTPKQIIQNTIEENKNASKTIKELFYGENFLSDSLLNQVKFKIIEMTIEALEKTNEYTVTHNQDENTLEINLKKENEL